MKKILGFLFAVNGIVYAQSYGECKQRFENYLNFKGSLNNIVKFDSNAIYILNSGKRQTAFYTEELGVLAHFFKNSDLVQQQKLLEFKGVKKLSILQLDSLRLAYSKIKEPRDITLLPLSGLKIALDPGHFATSLAEAKWEQKFLYFLKDTVKRSGDSIKLFESLLTFNTAKMLQNMLREQGAEVLLTRNTSDHTSFDCTYSDWLKRHKVRVLDSLEKSGSLPKAKKMLLLKSDEHKFFWDFFRDFDLANRANKINEFKPDLTVIIHYNVDEKNAPWKKTSDKNFTMTFIGGAFTAGDIARKENNANFTRLLVSDQLNRSQVLASKTVQNFNKNLGIPIASAADADYLKDNCISTQAPGVFCRNLFLCRKINSVLVYGESLYQDNEKEVNALMRTDLDSYGIKTNARIAAVSRSYYEAILDFCKND